MRHLARWALRRDGQSPEAYALPWPSDLARDSAGKVDLALGPFQTRADIRDFVAEHGLDYVYSELILDDGVGMAVCKGNAELLATLNSALDAIRSDGTLASLENRWFQ